METLPVGPVGFITQSGALMGTLFDRAVAMGVGFSPGDEYCDEPYFYVSMYPEPSIPGLPLLPALGHWHTYKFLAALAPAHKIVAATDQGRFVENFLDVAIAAALDRLR